MATSSLVGRVKFFDTKKGFGFICGDVFNPKNNQSDYFVHYKDVCPRSNNYPVTLRPNEYVQFEVHETEHADPNKRLKAVNVTGIAGGPLIMDATRMRRTRHDRHAPPTRRNGEYFSTVNEQTGGRSGYHEEEGEDGGGGDGRGGGGGGFGCPAGGRFSCSANTCGDDCGDDCGDNCGDDCRDGCDV